jgi:hypothetical protein
MITLIWPFIYCMYVLNYHAVLSRYVQLLGQFLKAFGIDQLNC